MNIQIGLRKKLKKLFMGEETHDRLVCKLSGTIPVASVFQSLACEHKLDTGFISGFGYRIYENILPLLIGKPSDHKHYIFVLQLFRLRPFLIYKIRIHAIGYDMKL